MNLLTSILVAFASVITLVGVIAYLAYPRYAAHRREAAFRAKIAHRLSMLFNTKESLQQHIDWAKADNEPERARALQGEVRSLDAEMEGLEKELAILDNQQRRRHY